MASLENGINGDCQDQHIDTAGTVSDFTDLESLLKREKARTKSNFTRIKNKLLFLIEQRELPSQHEIQDACSRMDNCMESAMDAMINLSELYMKYKEKGKNNKVVLELDTLDDEYSSAHKAARQYIDTQKEQSSDASEMLSIDLLNRMSISDKSETFRKDGPNVSHEVGIVSSHSNTCNSMSFK